MIDRIFAAPRGGDWEAYIAFARENKLDFEISSFMHPENLERGQAEIERYRQMLDGYQGLLSMRGPIFDLNPVSPDPDIAALSRKRYLQAIEVAKQLDVRYLIFNSQYTPIYPAANVIKNWLARTTDFWESLIAEHVEGSSLIVLVQNFLEETPETLHTLASRVDSPHFKLCLDTGYINIFSKQSPIDWIRELGHDTVYIRAHNNNGEVDEHESLDVGLMDMDGFLNHLALLPQRAHVAIKTGNLDGMRKSYEMIRPYLQLQNEQHAAKSFLI